MNSIKHFIVPALWVATTVPVHASAYYFAGISGRLTIWEISTKSIFEQGEPVSETVPGFTITVDPLFADPTLQVMQAPTVISGSGDYTAEAGASASLTAENPFDIKAGDFVSIYASADGRALDTADSFAESAAAVSATLYLVNNSDEEVAVDTLWSTSGFRDTVYSGPDGENADARIDLSPPIAGDISGGTTPLVFKVPAGTTQELDLMAPLPPVSHMPRRQFRNRPRSPFGPYSVYLPR